MIKVTLICIIIAIATHMLTKLMTGTMSAEEASRAVFADEFPMRINIVIWIHILSIIAAIITAIIAIIQWR